MKILIGLITLVICFCQTSFADETPGQHSTEVCSTENSSVCAHLKFLSPITTAVEGHFIVHVTTADNSQVNNLKVELSMQMGQHNHGTAPVNVVPMDGELNHYDVTNAWFVMRGAWTVQIQFAKDSQTYTISIPVTVQE